MSQNGVDIFPNRPTEGVVRKLDSYPEKSFKFWTNSTDVKAFVLYCDERGIVYYSKQPSPLIAQHLEGVAQIGKGCQVFDEAEFAPRKIDWKKIWTKFRRPPQGTMRKNADVRLGFKRENTFLVKAFFTFGLRTVRPGTIHLIQTLEVPLLLYVRSGKRKVGSSAAAEKSFPYEDMPFYDMSTLLPRRAYGIPSGTRYLLLTTQKNYFSLDVIDETVSRVPFDYENPIGRKKKKLEDVYDRPPPTPYIDSVAMPPPPPPPQDFIEQSDIMREFFEPPAATTLEPQQITYYYVTPAILDRNVVVATQDFVETYQKMKRRKLEDPEIGIVRCDGDDEPLDLSVRSKNDDDGIIDLDAICSDDILPKMNVSEEELDRLLNSLQEPYR